MKKIANILKLSVFSILLFQVSVAIAVDSKEDTSKSYYKQEPQTITVVSPDKISWNTMKVFPGALVALLLGDPRKEGPYILRVKFPSNYIIPPNWQTATSFVTVISGSLHIGVGDNFDRNKGKTLVTENSVVIPSKSHLYFWTTEEVVLQVHGMGPWDIHYINPGEDPRKHP